MAIDKEHASIVLKRVFENGVCSDQITLISDKDGQRFPIHRAVLTATSKYFRAALGPNFQEGDKSEFILEGTDSETVKTVVDFCYTGRIDLTEENVSKFQAIASSIELDLLEKKCHCFYGDHLSVKSAIDTWVVADKYSYKDLRQRALDLICESFETVSTTDIQKLNHELLRELLKSDTIQATEDMIFKRLLEWFENNEDERKPHMIELIKLIRLEYISSQFLDDSSLEATYKRFDCLELFIAGLKIRAQKSQSSDVGAQRCRSIFSLFAQYKGEKGADYSAIKIEKYNSKLIRKKEYAEITLGDRMFFGVIFQKNKIYILGGSVNDVPLKSVSAYGLTSREEEILPEMNLARDSFASISFGKYIYVFGGQIQSGYTYSCERFDTETKTWKIIKPMNVARCCASVAVLNEYIYVAGGQVGSNFLNSVELYDPKTDEWIQLAPMSIARVGFALVQSNGFLYAIGYRAMIEKYDPWKANWEQIGSFEESVWITSATEIDGEIVAIKINGQIGQIKFNESHGCSFVPLSKSNFKSKFSRKHYLCQN